MEMKTKKKNKLFLAMTLVVAFAMVSVAGIVAISDDADAAPLIPIGSSDDAVVISGDSAIELNFYASVWSAINATTSINIGYVYVPSGESVSGTISIGTLVGGVYTATDTIKVTNAGGFRVTLISAVIDGQSITILAIGNVDDSDEVPTGTFEVTKGKAVLGQVSPGQLDDIISGYNPWDPLSIIGSLDTTPFTGTLKVKDLVLEAKYVAGTIVSAEGDVALLAGLVNPYPPTATTETGLSLSGTANVEYPASLKQFVVNYTSLPISFESAATVTIEEGAVITIDATEPLTVGAVEISTVATGALWYAALIDADNNVIPASYPSTYAAEFDVGVGEYTMIVMLEDTLSGDSLVYYGKYTVSGAKGSYTAVLEMNELSGATSIANSDLTISAVDSEITYDETQFLNVFAFNLDNWELGDVDAGTGTVTFPNGTSGDWVLFFAVDFSAIGQPTSVYIGDSTGNDLVGFVDVVSGTPTSDNELTVSGVSANASINYFYVGGDLTVKGTLKVLYSNSIARGHILNTGHIYILDDGVIEYGVTPAVTPVAPLSNLGNIDAAYYYKNVLDGAVVKASTYYFTTITNAVKNSDGQDIVVIGFHEILEDTTWSVDQATRIILGTPTHPATLNIGRYGHLTLEDKNAALNIDDQITIVKGNATSVFEVRNGQAIFNTNTFPTYPPIAHVRIVRDAENKIIYADVATGFTIVRSGETLELIMNAELRSDATLIAGATFDDKGFIMTIPAGMTLTVNGIYNGSGVLTIKRDATGTVGTLIVNSGTVTFETGSFVNVEGSLKVNAAGTFTLDGEMYGYGVGVLVIDGIFNANGDVFTINELELRGVLNISGMFDVVGLITIGAEPTLLSALQNNAVLNGTIDIASTTIVLVYGNSSVGKANFNNIGGIGETKFVYQNLSTVYATQYGVSAGLIYLTCDALLDFTLKAWYQTAGMTPATEVTPSMFLSAVPGTYAVLYGDFVHKTFTVTLSDSNEGINWIVNGVGQGASKTITFNYGDKVKVNVHVLNGFTGTPVILKDGASYAANTEFTVTANSVFTVSGVKVADPPKDDGGLTLIEILLIIIVIIIAIISIIVALRLLRS